MIERLANYRGLCVVAVIAFGLVGVVNLADFSWTVPGFKKISGGITFLDMQPSFSAETTYHTLAAYGAKGRSHYLKFLLTLDIVLPFAIFMFLRVAVTLALRDGYSTSSPAQRLKVLPLLYLAMDYVENILILPLLFFYPTRLPLVAGTVGYITTAKFIFAWTSLALAVIGLLLRLARGRVSSTVVDTENTTST